MTISVQLNHRTIREFTTEPVSEEILQQLYQVAMHTPSSQGLQQSSIIRVTDEKMRIRLAEIGAQEYVSRAPVYLIFLADTARNAAILREAGVPEAGAARAQTFVEAFTDTCLMAQNVAVAAESLGLGVNYLGNIHNDTAGVISLLNLPRYTFPVVAMTLGWPNQSPQLKPRLDVEFRVMENGYQAPESWTEALAEYDKEMTTYYDLRNATRRVDSFTQQVIKRLPPEAQVQDKSLEAARAQGFDI